MRNWQLKNPDWEAIARCLPPPRHGGETHIAWEQPAASTFIWCRVTQGEREFSPWIIQGGQLHLIHQTLRNFRYAKPHRRHRPLLDILTALANHLTNTVDTDEFKVSSLNIQDLLPLGDNP